MASNLYTTQTPRNDASTKVVLAERAYIAAADSGYADPTAKLEGATPAISGGGSWDDLGVVQGSQIQLTYSKETKFIETGIEKVRRGSYVLSKTAQAAFTLEQFDMAVIELVSGLTKTTFSGGAKIHVGQDDVVNRAFLFVGVNKTDDKEYHTYCKKGGLTWQIEQADDARVMKVTADLYAFNPGSGGDAYYTLFIVD